MQSFFESLALAFEFFFENFSGQFIYLFSEIFICVFLYLLTGVVDQPFQEFFVFFFFEVEKKIIYGLGKDVRTVEFYIISARVSDFVHECPGDLLEKSVDRTDVETRKVVQQCI